MMARTAKISENGGTSTAKTMVSALKELGQVISGGSSGGGPLVINATLVEDQDSDMTITADKTFEEVLPHLVAGGDAVMLLVADGSGSNNLMLRLTGWTDVGIYFIGFGSGLGDYVVVVMDDLGTHINMGVK